MKKIILTTLCVVVFGFANAQSGDPVKDFDFWIGKWDVKMSVAPNWEEKTGHDEVSYLLNGRLIEEVFTKGFGDKSNFQRGYLTYVVRDKKWKHTIYDEKWGEYTFEGNKVGDKMVLQSLETDTRPGMRRETFSNISKDGFTYLWEGSYDKGKTWQEEWKVVYTRKQN